MFRVFSVFTIQEHIDAEIMKKEESNTIEYVSYLILKINFTLEFMFIKSRYHRAGAHQRFEKKETHLKLFPKTNTNIGADGSVVRLVVSSLCAVVL